MTLQELVVKLALDSSGLDKAAGPAGAKLKSLETQGAKTEQSVEKIGKTSSRAASGVGDLAKALGSFLAVLGGTVAIKAFVSDLIDSSAALDRLSKNLGLSAGDITAWSNAAETLGGSAKGIQASMSMLSKAQTQIAITGESSLVPYFNFLGVSLADTNGKARKVTDVFADLASKLEGRDRATSHNILAEMGFSEDTINLILLGRKELDITLRHQTEYAEKMKQFSGEGTKLQHALVDIKQSFTLLGLNLLQSAAPALEKILGALQHVGSWLAEHKGFIIDFFKVFAAGIAIVGAALGAAELEDAPILAAIFAVAGLAFAIGLLWDDYQHWKNGSKSLIPWGNWKSEIDAAAAGMEFLRKIAVTAFDAIATAAKVAQQAMHGDWAGAKQTLSSGTVKMNRVMGVNAGPDAAHDQNASKADALVKKGVKLVKEVAHSVTSQQAGFETGGKASQAELMAYYMSKGKSKDEAAALASNAWSESSGDPTSVGDHGAAYGLMQWHGDRQADFKKKYGFDIRQATWQQQADFQMFELSSEGKESRAGRHMARAKTAAEMAAIESRESQRPGLTQSAKDKAAASRASLAQILAGVTGASSNVQMAGTRGVSNVTSNDNRVSNHIDSVTINAPSGNAQSIASAFQSLNIFPAVAVVGVR